MPQPDHVMALPVPDPDGLDDDLKAHFAKCMDKLGLVPNVLRAYGLRPAKLRTFIALYNELMLGDSGLSKLEREMIAVTVSSANHCYYCLVAHGQATAIWDRNGARGQRRSLPWGRPIAPNVTSSRSSPHRKWPSNAA